MWYNLVCTTRLEWTRPPKGGDAMHISFGEVLTFGIFLIALLLTSINVNDPLNGWHQCGSLLLIKHYSGGFSPLKLLYWGSVAADPYFYSYVITPCLFMAIEYPPGKKKIHYLFRMIPDVMTHTQRIVILVGRDWEQKVTMSTGDGERHFRER
jgi:hypothetical protein